MQPTQPSTPRALRPFTNDELKQHFGTFTFKAQPLDDNAEHFVVTNRWAKDNLVSFPLHAHIAKLPGGNNATFHQLVRPRFDQLIQAWEEEGLLEDILTWNGSYASRFIRGSKNNVSAHAFGAAFDVNAPYNPLGKDPAKIGTKGSVLRLVPIAEQFGFFWGGKMKNRPDGMHFELARF